MQCVPIRLPGVANATFHTGTARAVGEPRIDLSQVIVKRLANRHRGVFIRSRSKDTQFNLIARRIGLGAQEVGLAGLQQAVDFGAVAFVLLMDSFILVPAFQVLHDR